MTSTRLPSIPLLRIGLIGDLNGPAARWLTSLRAHDVQVHSFDPARTSSRDPGVHFGVRRHDSLTALLAQQPHGIVVADGRGRRLPHAMQALKFAAGRQHGPDRIRRMALELPAALDHGMTRELLRAAQDAGVAVGAPCDQLAMLRQTLGELRSGAIGDVTRIAYARVAPVRAPGELLDSLLPHAFAVVLAILPRATVGEVVVTTTTARDESLRHVIAARAGGVEIAIDLSNEATAVDPPITLAVHGEDGRELRTHLRSEDTPENQAIAFRPWIEPPGRDGFLDPIMPALDAHAIQVAGWLESFAGPGGSLPVGAAELLEIERLLAEARRSVAPAQRSAALGDRPADGSTPA